MWKNPLVVTILDNYFPLDIRRIIFDLYCCLQYDAFHHILWQCNDVKHQYKCLRIKPFLSKYDAIYDPLFFDGFRILDLSGCNLFSIPIELTLLKNLVELKLNHNKISSVPNELLFVHRLRILHLEANKFKTVSDILGKMKLIQIYLNSNSLKKLPISLRPIVSSYPQNIRWVNDNYYYEIFVKQITDFEQNLQ